MYTLGIASSDLLTESTQQLPAVFNYRAMQTLQIDFKENENKAEVEKLFQGILETTLSSSSAGNDLKDRGRPRSTLRSEEQPVGHQASSLDEVELALETESRRDEVVHGHDCPLRRAQDKKTLSETNIRSAKTSRTSYHACLASR